MFSIILIFVSTYSIQWVLWIINFSVHLLAKFVVGLQGLGQEKVTGLAKTYTAQLTPTYKLKLAMRHSPR